MITPNNTRGARSEKVPEPARYNPSGQPTKEYRSPDLDDHEELDEEEKNQPKMKLTEYVSRIKSMGIS